MELHNIFSNFIVTDMIDEIDVNEIHKSCLEAKTENKQTERNQYHPSIIDERFKPLYSAVDRRFDFIGKEVLNLRGNFSGKIVRAWINYDCNVSIIRSHNHPSKFLCATYFVTAGSNLRFTTPNPLVEWVVPTARDTTVVNESNQYTKVWYDVKPEPGKIVIFPSWMNHYVAGDSEEKDRISIALDSRLFDGNVYYLGV